MTILNSIHTQKLKIFFLATVIFFAVSIPADDYSYDQFSVAVNSAFIDNDANQESLDDPSIDVIHALKPLANNPARFSLITSDSIDSNSKRRTHSIRAPPRVTFV